MVERGNGVTTSMFPNVGTERLTRSRTFTGTLRKKSDYQQSGGSSRRSQIETLLSSRRPESSVTRSCGGLSRSNSEVPFITSVIKRQPRPRRYHFDALNRNSVPVPNLFDKKTDGDLFVPVDIQLWKDQVKKVVPRRPRFAISSTSGSAMLYDWEINDDFIQSTNSVFYTSRKCPGDRNFVINPQWVSEKVSLKSGPKAYRTCAIRYGWCS